MLATGSNTSVGGTTCQFWGVVVVDGFDNDLVGFSFGLACLLKGECWPIQRYICLLIGQDGIMTGVHLNRNHMVLCD